MFSKVESTRGNKAAQIFTNGLTYNRFYPMKGKGEASEALMSFINNTGIPQNLVSDGALEESKGNWEKVTKKYHIRQKLIIPHSPWANLAESSVRELKAGVRRATRRRGSPMRICATVANGSRLSDVSLLSTYPNWMDAFRRKWSTGLHPTSLRTDSSIGMSPFTFGTQ